LQGAAVKPAIIAVFRHDFRLKDMQPQPEFGSKVSSEPKLLGSLELGI
jgi:hypothetical protein